jgi:hypothetical protein
MVGNNANLDILQLGLHLTGTTEVSTILAKYPHWDRALHCLKLPALLKDGLAVHNHIDHINPALWHSNVKVSQVVLQTCWKLGRLQIEKEFPFFASILCAATDSSFNIFSPLGMDLVKALHNVYDCDDTVDRINALSCEGPA